MASELLSLCDFPIAADSPIKTLTVSKNFPQFRKLGTSPMILPIQESLTVALPAAAIADSDFQPFASNPPTFREFIEEIDVMSSLAKPRKIVILGTDGQKYPFLCKPKDDLRKDARLMDFNALINQIFKANSESRRRQLHVRTYAIVPLNEDSGILQWVPNTTPMRSFLLNLYKTRKNLSYWLPCMHETFKRIKARTRDSEAGELFVKEILPLFPPIFHEWFLEAFPEPSVWLARRLVFTRTAAVGSIIGWILGLGDRHLENILIDVTSGDAIHIDFNCLFDRGKTLDVPERVPFRLTQNMVAAFGVTGYEGPFRIACEKSVGLFRTNKESLLSVLDAFLHDPLVEWEDAKRKMDREARKPIRAGKDIPQGNQAKPSTDLRTLAKRSMNPIEKRISGIYQPGSGPKEKIVEREIPVDGLVHMLILEATDPNNLGAMYPGWAPWY
jgi:serine/threonine-protein kinase ATR